MTEFSVDMVNTFLNNPVILTSLSHTKPKSERRIHLKKVTEPVKLISSSINYSTGTVCEWAVTVQRSINYNLSGKPFNASEMCTILKEANLSSAKTDVLHWSHKHTLGIFSLTTSTQTMHYIHKINKICKNLMTSSVIPFIPLRKNLQKTKDLKS